MEVEKLVYIAWKKAHDPGNVEIEVELDETDRSYLKGLLVQYYSVEFLI